MLRLCPAELVWACRLTFCDSGDSRKSGPKGRFHSGLEREQMRLDLDSRENVDTCGHVLTDTLPSNTPMCTYTQTHHPHTYHSLPAQPPRRKGTVLKALLGGRRLEGCAQKADPFPRGASYPGGDVWGVKIGRPSREAVVAGTLA